MMKHIRKLVSLMMVVLLFTTVFSVSAMAAKKPSSTSAKNDDIVTMISGKWYDGKYKQLFCIKLSKDSIVSFQWKSNSKDKPMGMYFYNDKEGNNCLLNYHDFRQDNATSGTKSFAIAQGTYYLKIQGTNWDDYRFEGKSLGKFMIKVSKLNDKMNYCPARAVVLKKNTKCTYGTTPMNQPIVVWYKIRTIKKQKITVYTSDESISCSMYDKDLKHIDMESYGSQTDKTKQTLPAGTYYLQVWAPQSHNAYIAETRTFWWK